jgi:hypothetical protein
MAGVADLTSFLAAVRAAEGHDELPWSAAEIDAAFSDSMDALEFFIALDERTDGEALELMVASGQSLGELAASLMTERMTEGSP